MANVLRFPDGEKRPPLEELVQRFLDDLESENRSPNTLRSYRADLRAFLKFFQGEVSAVSSEVVRAYFKTFQSRTPATQARHRGTLKAFFGWLVRQDILHTNPMEKLGSVRVPERQPRPLKEEDVVRLLRSFENKRDRLLFTLIADTGLRISEALGIRREDIRLDAQEITVRSKGNRERTVYLVKTEALRLLRQFLRESTKNKGLLFQPNEEKRRSGRSGEPLHYTTVLQAFKAGCERAGVHATIHQLRHSYATKLLRQGKPIEVVSKVLGHKRIATTQLYTQISDESVKKALTDD